MQTTIIIHVAGPPAASVTFTPAPTLRAPVAKGTVLGKLVILPSTWTGNVTVTGADAGLIAVDAAFNVTAAADLTTGRDYTATVGTVE